MNDVQEVQISQLYGCNRAMEVQDGHAPLMQSSARLMRYQGGDPKKSLVSKRATLFPLLLICSFSVLADLKPVSDQELGLSSARSGLPIPLLDQIGFDLSASGIEVDLDVQADIGSIEWIDESGFGENASKGSLSLKGVHIGGFDGDITQKMVRSDRPFASTDLAMIRGMLVQADPEAGTLITINQLGREPGQGIDIIVNDIYFGQDLSLNPDVNGQHRRGLGLLLEDVSNFASDAYVQQINDLFGLQFNTRDDGFNSQGGDYYPIQVSMLPLDVSIENRADLLGISDLLPGTGLDEGMRIDAQFMIHMKKLAVYKQMDNGSEFEMGIEGLMLYQGLDTNNDGVEDTIGPATMGLTMLTIPHQLSDGSTVQAMHFSDINLTTDIAMANVYIGNAQTGSLGAIHIDNLEIIDTQMWIYPH